MYNPSYKITKTTERGLKMMWFENKQGDCFYIDWVSPDYGLHINLETMTADKTSVNCPTLNDLCGKGEWTEKFCYESFYINKSKEYYNSRVLKIEDIDIDGILDYCKNSGWEISKEGLVYCISGWLEDYKSAYRDEEHGIHIFIPCGHNPLFITLTKLHPLCEDWQITYQA